MHFYDPVPLVVCFSCLISRNIAFQYFGFGYAVNDKISKAFTFSVKSANMPAQAIIN